ncbi:hypothetical protein D3C71_1983630 [compost metagenome]
MVEKSTGGSSGKNRLNRSFISTADALLKVTALIRDGATPFSSIKKPVRIMIVVVLPEPGVASSSIGPSVCTAAFP